jgi:hypothetical protein
VNNTPDRGPHHADDTTGEKVILVEFVAKMVPHDSPEFQERAKMPRPPRPSPPEEPKPDQNPPAAT